MVHRSKEMRLTDTRLDRLNIFLCHQVCIDLLDISVFLLFCHKVKSFMIFPTDTNKDYQFNG